MEVEMGNNKAQVVLQYKLTKIYVLKIYINNTQLNSAASSYHSRF